MQDKWRKMEHCMERAETSTGLGGEGGACKTSGGRWSTAWRELIHKQVWVGKVEHARQVEEDGALHGES